MKYKGYTITPVYFIGSNFRILRDGTLKERKPTKDDIEFYRAVDDDGSVINCDSIEECKSSIDILESAVSMFLEEIKLAESEKDKLDCLNRFYERTEFRERAEYSYSL